MTESSYYQSLPPEKKREYNRRKTERMKRQDRLPDDWRDGRIRAMEPPDAFDFRGQDVSA